MEELIVITLGGIITITLATIAWYLRIMVKRTEQIPLIAKEMKEIKKEFHEFKNDVWKELTKLREQINDYIISEANRKA